MARNNPPPIEIDLEPIEERHTPKAWAVKDPTVKPRSSGSGEPFGGAGGSGREEVVIIWLPKSQVTREGKTFTVPEWLAVEKGIENLAN